MNPAHKKPILLSAAAVILAGGIILALPGGPAARLWEQRKSHRNLDRIAVALCAYSRHHRGTLPVRLSKLFPDYIDDHEAFFVHDSNHANPSLPDLDLETPQAIDLHSPYTIMASLTGSRAMVFERPGLWKDASIAWRKLELGENQSAFSTGESDRSAGGAFAGILKEFLEVDPGEIYRTPTRQAQPPSAPPSPRPAP